MLRSLHNKVGFGEFVIGILCVLAAVVVLGSDKFLVGFLIVPPMFFLLFAIPYVVVRRLLMFWRWLLNPKFAESIGMSKPINSDEYPVQSGADTPHSKG